MIFPVDHNTSCTTSNQPICHMIAAYKTFHIIAMLASIRSANRTER
jgi:hypothetical protein